MLFVVLTFPSGDITAGSKAPGLRLWVILHQLSLGSPILIITMRLGKAICNGLIDPILNFRKSYTHRDSDKQKLGCSIPIIIINCP